MRLVNGVRRNFLGAIELVELGQAQLAPAPTTTVPLSLTAPTVPSPSRTVAVSADEASLIMKTVQNVVEFAQDFPIEFHSYCPTERWQETLNKVGTWSAEVERQLKSGAKTVNVPADAIFRLVDLEKCASAARESRLKAAKWAFGLSAAGTIANVVLGLSWVTVPTYLAGLGILFGGPIIARLSAEPQEPYKPSIGCTKAYSMAGCAPPHETEEEKAMIKLIERVILAERRGPREHWWGKVDCNPGGQLATTCLKKGRLRVRVEGWEGDTVTPAPGWEFSTDCEDRALNVIGVYEVDSGVRETGFGPLPEKSRHPETYWVEYTGPKTGGQIRRAGPFGCPLDTRDHAIEDGGITKQGEDGDYVLMDVNGEMIPVEAP
jgi:hypothetical protein